MVDENTHKSHSGLCLGRATVCSEDDSYSQPLLAFVYCLFALNDGPKFNASLTTRTYDYLIAFYDEPIFIFITARSCKRSNTIDII